MVTRLSHWLLRIAVRRWPGRLRAEVAREWDAELSAIDRGWRRLTFSASLACARPPHRASLPLRSLWRPGLTMLLAPLGGLLGEMCVYLVLFLRDALQASALVDNIVLYAALLGLATVAALVGHWIGAEQRTSAGTRLVALVVLAAATATLLGGIDALNSRDPGRQARVLVAIGCWAVGLAATSTAVSRLTGRARALVVRGVALLGGLLSLYLAIGAQVVQLYGAQTPWSLAPWWLPGALFGSDLGPEAYPWLDWGNSGAYFDRMSYVMPFATVFALAYLLSAARREAGEAAAGGSVA
ncbi:hypothetical protein Lfu02_29860 [Longispora fulva]|uniref:Uncharacterized protein n=1 Tax=Longispora fulva TaxID=619741 RepID=A0A8J7KS18_9ACTN|nr:hypothetical protein [Longispora fulva]MBG6139122.1 hypothetical protein [Longispora fulva]GIG58614.1 hypothetical protein Lfu02_29860 [Longispora fulva]